MVHGPWQRMDPTGKAALLSNCGKGVGPTWTDTSPEQGMPNNEWSGDEADTETPACASFRKTRPRACLPEKYTANKKTQQGHRQTRTAAEKYGNDGGLGKDGTTVDDDERRKTKTALPGSSLPRLTLWSRRYDQTFDLFQAGRRSCFSGGVCGGQGGNMHEIQGNTRAGQVRPILSSEWVKQGWVGCNSIERLWTCKGVPVLANWSPGCRWRQCQKDIRRKLEAHINVFSG